tara:strand:- start:15 stop:383 length:369 start_codon:yes stop_codon:yes gene_type:complete
MTKKLNATYKSISEVAELLNLVNQKTGKLSTHTLRFWEKEFKQIKPNIFAGKRRYYDENSINTLKKIKFLLKDKGMTIDGVKKLLVSENSNLDETLNISINTKNILKSKINKISKIVKELKK